MKQRSDRQQFQPSAFSLQPFSLLGLDPDCSLIFLSVLAWGLAMGLYQNLWPVFLTDLGADHNQIGLIIGLGYAMRLVSYLPGGLMAARYERKWMLITSCGMAALAALNFATARTWQAVIPGTILYGLGEFSTPAMFSYMQRAAGPERAARTFSTVMAGFIVGLAVGPLPGALLVEHIGYGGMFAVACAGYVLTILTLVRLTPQRPLPIERDTHYVEQWSRLIRQPQFWKLCAIFFCGIFVLNLPLTQISDYFHLSLGLDAVAINALGALTLVVGALWMAGYHRVLPARRDHWSMIATEALVGLTLLGMLIARPLGSPVTTALWVGVWAVWSGAFQGYAPLAHAYAGNAIDDSVRSLGYAVFSMGEAGALALAAVADGLAYTADPQAPFAISLAALPVLMWLTWRMTRRAPHVDDPVQEAQVVVERAH